MRVQTRPGRGGHREHKQLLPLWVEQAATEESRQDAGSGGETEPLFQHSAVANILTGASFEPRRPGRLSRMC